MSKRKLTVLNSLGWLMAIVAFSSCAAPHYLPLPTVYRPAIHNVCTFGVQNMDEKAQIESDALTAHYDGFDVQYKISSDFTISLVITNNKNKSLIIDKSKSYVLYDGYSTQLFKDVRSSRSTTFNNVQDAINNVQTNESGVLMTVPPYSKWELPLSESNVRQIKTLPAFNTVVGTHALTAFDNKEVVEFILPYSYDYSMAEWDTSRNRVFVNSVETTTTNYTKKFNQSGPTMISGNQYRIIKKNGEPDYSEAERIDAINRKKYRQHNTLCKISHNFWTIPTCAINILFLRDFSPGCNNPEHYPPSIER